MLVDLTQVRHLRLVHGQVCMYMYGSLSKTLWDCQKARPLLPVSCQFFCWMQGSASYEGVQKKEAELITEKCAPALELIGHWVRLCCCFALGVIVVRFVSVNWNLLSLDPTDTKRPHHTPRLILQIIHSDRQFPTLETGKKKNYRGDFGLTTTKK